MEEILVLLLQALIEFTFEMLGVSGAFPTDSCGCGAFLALAVGALCGWLLNLIHPKVLLPFSWLRMSNLILAPLLSGWIAIKIAEGRLEKKPNINKWNRVIWAFCYTLALV